MALTLPIGSKATTGDLPQRSMHSLLALQLVKRSQARASKKHVGLHCLVLHGVSCALPGSMLRATGQIVWCKTEERLCGSGRASASTSQLLVGCEQRKLFSPCSCVCSTAEAVDLARFADHLAGSYIPNTVIIDATASEVPPSQYLAWMQKGIHIITPNKKLGSGPLDQYLALRSFQRESYIHFFYEVSHSVS